MPPNRVHQVLQLLWEAPFEMRQPISQTPGQLMELSPCDAIIILLEYLSDDFFIALLYFGHAVDRLV